MERMKDDILRIVDRTKGGRVRKICSLIKRDYVLQKRDDLVNIIIPAKEQQGKITVMAHHDVYPGSNGFNDNSTGVVLLLKLQSQIPDNVELVFTDGEECGGRGCGLYLDESIKPRIAINLDVVGLGDKIFYEEYGPRGRIKLGNEPIEHYSRIPFSDSYILRDRGVSNILMLTGSSYKELIGDIFEAQHCGRNDGRLDLIQESTMEMVLGSVLRIIEMNGGHDVR